MHKCHTQVCILQDDGQIAEHRIVTSSERLTTVFVQQPPATILLEAATESEWVAQCLERLGHTVVVADPTYALMYATRTRLLKPIAVMHGHSLKPVAGASTAPPIGYRPRNV